MCYLLSQESRLKAVRSAYIICAIIMRSSGLTLSEQHKAGKDFTARVAGYGLTRGRTPRVIERRNGAQLACAVPAHAHNASLARGSVRNVKRPECPALRSGRHMQPPRWCCVSLSLSLSLPPSLSPSLSRMVRPPRGVAHSKARAPCARTCDMRGRRLAGSGCRTGTRRPSRRKNRTVCSEHICLGGREHVGQRRAAPGPPGPRRRARLGSQPEVVEP